MKDSRIVKKLGGDHDTCDEKAMDVQGGDWNTGLLANEAIDVRISHHKARGAAVGVLENTLEILFDADVRSLEAMEHRHFLRANTVVMSQNLSLVPCNHAVKQRRKNRDYSRPFTHISSRVKARRSGMMELQ